MLRRRRKHASPRPPDVEPRGLTRVFSGFTPRTTGLLLTNEYSTQQQQASPRPPDVEPRGLTRIFSGFTPRTTGLLLTNEYSTQQLAFERRARFAHHQSNAALSSVLGSLAGYDIYIGVHGAQLANIVYGAPGLVLVEVQSMLWVRVSLFTVQRTICRFIALPDRNPAKPEGYAA